MHVWALRRAWIWAQARAPAHPLPDPPNPCPPHLGAAMIAVRQQQPLISEGVVFEALEKIQRERVS